MFIGLKKTGAAAFVAAAMLFAPASQAATLTLNGSGALNVDTSVPTLLTETATTSGTITDLNFYIDLDAACCGYDLTVVLTNLDTGTSATIWTTGFQTGWQFGDVRDTTFDDESPNVFFNTPLRSGFDIAPGNSFMPETPLSVFDGEDFAATWQLSLVDVDIPNEGDDVISWGLTAQTQMAIPLPAALPLMAAVLGLFGFLGFQRRRRFA